VLVANESASRTHTVTLRYPEDTRFYGDSLRGITRTAKLGPNSSASMVLWQPPLPASGRNVAVYVDGKYEGSAALPGNSRHGSAPVVARNSEVVRTFLISRSVNQEDMNALFAGVFGAPYSAAKATGSANASGSSGPVPETWVPAETNVPVAWLELDYEPAFPANRITVYENMHSMTLTEVLLFNPSGVQIGTVGAASGSFRRSGSNIREVSFGLTKEPVGRVRLMVENRGTGSPTTAIDAVQLQGPGRNAWATRARASSSLATSLATGSGSGRALPASLARRYGTYGVSARYGLSTEPKLNLVRSELEMSQWSDHWLAYSPYDTVLMTGRDYAALPEPARTALWRYAECGGCLVVLGRIEVPEPWRGRRGPADPEGEEWFVGFGRCLMFDVAEVKLLTEGQGRKITETARISASPWALPNPGDLGSANAQFPVIANVKIPFRSLVLILLVFVILIGPVNLILLSRRQKRIWSLWTIPLISFTTCGLVFVYSFLSEGITPHTRLEGVTLLDQVNHRATTLGMAAFFCPLTPRGGLRFSYDTELSPVLEMNFRSGGRPREVDWTQSQHFHTGWLASRVPAFFRIRKSETRRERIQLEKNSDGQYAVVNGLGAPIRALHVTGLTGRLYTATNVAAGQRVALMPIERSWTAKTNALVLADHYRFSNWAPVEPVWEKLQTNSLPAGSYLALLTTTPFIEDGLTGKTITERRAIVVGILDSGETPP
jgi:hypothetical protein